MANLTPATITALDAPGAADNVLGYNSAGLLRKISVPTLLFSVLNKVPLSKFAASAATWATERVGTTDATATLLAGITAIDTLNAAELAASRRASYVLCPEAAQIKIGASNTAVGGATTTLVPRILCDTNDFTIVIDGKTTTNAIEFAGTYGTDIPFSTTSTDNQNSTTTGIGAPSRGQTRIVLNTSSHGLTAGMWIKVCSADLIGGQTNLYWGEPCEIKSVSSATIELTQPLCYTYTRATSFVRRIVGMENVLLSNFTIINANQRSGTAGSIRISSAIRARIEGIRQIGIDNIGMGLRDVVDSDITDVSHTDSPSDASTNGRNPYCIQIQDASGYNRFSNILGRRIRTTITTNNSGGATAKYGAPTRNDIQGASYDNDTVGASTHTPGLDNYYHDFIIEGVNKTGMANEARYTRCERFTINGAAIGFTNTDQGIGFTLARNTYFNPYRYSYLNTSDYVYGSWVEEFDGGHFLKMTTGTTDLTDCKVYDNIAVCASTFVQLATDNAHRLEVMRNRVTCGLSNRSGERAFIRGTQAQIDINDMKVLNNTLIVAAADQLIGDAATVSGNLHPAASASSPNLLHGKFSGTGNHVAGNSIYTSATSLQTALLTASNATDIGTTAQSLQVGVNSLNGVDTPYYTTYNGDAATNTFALDRKTSSHQRTRPNGGAGGNTYTFASGTAPGQRMTVEYIHGAASNTIAKPSNVSGTWHTFSTTSGQTDVGVYEWTSTGTPKWLVVGFYANVGT